MKIRPLHDRVVIQRISSEEKTASGIIIPDNAKEKPVEGIIISVGNGKVTEDGKARPLDVKPGMKVLFNKYAGNEVKINGEDFLIMREDEVLAILED